MFTATNTAQLLIITMINFTKEELEEILRTFRYGSYPSKLGDNDQPKRRKSIKTKIVEVLEK